MAAQAYGNQIALLPSFYGEVGSDVVRWIAVFLRTARQFNWIDAVKTPEQEASVAKNKLIGKAAFWLDTERRGGAETDIWDTIQAAAASPRPARIGLKDGLRFKVDISQLEATEVVMDLDRKSNETIKRLLGPRKVGNGGREPLHQHGRQGQGHGQGQRGGGGGQRGGEGYQPAHNYGQHGLYPSSPQWFNHSQGGGRDGTYAVGQEGYGTNSEYGPNPWLHVQ
jgi:hypothetical protein